MSEVLQLHFRERYTVDSEYWMMKPDASLTLSRLRTCLS